MLGNSVYVAIAGEEVNRRLVHLRGFVLFNANFLKSVTRNLQFPIPPNKNPTALLQGTDTMRLSF